MKIINMKSTSTHNILLATEQLVRREPLEPGKNKGKGLERKLFKTTNVPKHWI